MIHHHPLTPELYTPPQESALSTERRVMRKSRTMLLVYSIAKAKPLVSAHSVSVIRFWPKPMAWTRRKDDTAWRRTIQQIDLSLQPYLRSLESAMSACQSKCPDYINGQQFLPGVGGPLEVMNLQQEQSNYELLKQEIERIPEDIRKEVSPFPESHFALLNLVARCEGALDLLRSTPALAFMLANASVFLETELKVIPFARTMVKAKQHLQAESLGFILQPKSMIRVLRKVPRAICDVELLLSLRTSANDMDIRPRLAHLTRINRGVVRIVSNKKILDAASPSLLAEVSLAPAEDREAVAAIRLMQVLSFYEEHGAKVTPNMIRSLDHLQEEFEWVCENENSFDFEGFVDMFPAPPIEGTEVIVPIRDEDDLLWEGIAQRHCIGDFVKDILEGRKYAYRIFEGEGWFTVLIELKKLYGKRTWRLVECRGRKNKHSSPRTVERIERWLKERQVQESNSLAKVRYSSEGKVKPTGKLL